jgi:F0F1-type ATP synthase membrane subunit c/vacuolar-type H+-ATPase subunit K
VLAAGLFFALCMFSSALSQVTHVARYIGTEKPECDELVAALMSALAQHPNLEVTILIDYLRGTRGRKRKDVGVCVRARR